VKHSTIIGLHALSFPVEETPTGRLRLRRVCCDRSGARRVWGRSGQTLRRRDALVTVDPPRNGLAVHGGDHHNGDLSAVLCQ
jgi:hypothetical protein